MTMTVEYNVMDPCTYLSSMSLCQNHSQNAMRFALRA